MATKKLKGFLINPYQRTVEEVEVEHSGGSSYVGLKNAIGCDRVDCVSLGDQDTETTKKGNDIWVDDEGMYANTMFFRQSKLAPMNLLPGKAVVLGVDLKNGSTTDTSLTKEEVMDGLEFLTQRDALIVAERLGI